MNVSEIDLRHYWEWKENILTLDTNILEVARLEDLCYGKEGETASEIERRPGERGFVEIMIENPR